MFRNLHRMWAPVLRYGIRHLASAAAPVGSRAASFAALLRMPVFWGRCPTEHREGAWVLFPISGCTFYCGLAGLVSVRRKSAPPPMEDFSLLERIIRQIKSRPLDRCMAEQLPVSAHYLGGEAPLDHLHAAVNNLKREESFLHLFGDRERQAIMAGWSEQLTGFIHRELPGLQAKMGALGDGDVETADQRIEKLKDVAWCMQEEILANIGKTGALMGGAGTGFPPGAVRIFYHLNTVLNSIDRLEVRGRDSAGLSLLFILAPEVFATLQEAWTREGHAGLISERLDRPIPGNRSINIHLHGNSGPVGLTLTYRVAAEVGSLGDNVRTLRREIASDPILHLVTRHPHMFHTVSAHTRWASVGAVTIANCHPADNATTVEGCAARGIIHTCLNGDIDNHLEIKQQLGSRGEAIPEEITTDTKIIPLQIEHYLQRGVSVEEAFRLAVSDFEGSHAITMHTDLAPGKFFLAQKGSGQAVFVGLAEDHYLPASEVYGFVEQTALYLKLNGEEVVQGPGGPVRGQVFILDQDSSGGLDGVRAMYYDGTPLHLTGESIKHTGITSRDVDRQDFPHYFLKEISEAPASVMKTLQNRWKVGESGDHTVNLPESAFPRRMVEALAGGRVRRIYFVGQGTAGIAAGAAAGILDYYLDEPSLKVSALKASELSGFQLDSRSRDGMADALVIAISQSGTTTDTNRAVDMARERGALTMAIVNRRDSDLTFKVDGVVYTSSGRDIEMSVASTKAFYSQIVAGALVGLKIAEARERRSAAFIGEEIKALLELPDRMRRVLALGERIRDSANRLATTRTYWAAVGSGPNKAAADEIRIKLSELCYKTISSDYVEDKKHIDLSSEPLIFVCAAGAPAAVAGDLVKDTAIFRAHKAVPVVVADEGETRFDVYAEDVFPVPAVKPHLAPVLNTLAGHLWGYYAALAINSGSKFLHQFREEITGAVDRYNRAGLDIYEVVLEKEFREQVLQFYTKTRRRVSAGRLPGTAKHCTDLLLLLKYLGGRLPVADFELDFGMRGTAANMFNSLLDSLEHFINHLSRPIDAIKHQAKTVTVGTSRTDEKVEGVLFDALSAHEVGIGQLSNRNILMLRNLQQVVSGIRGSILYRIDGLDRLGEPNDHTTIVVVRKDGALAVLPSRVETDSSLKGTKHMVVRQGDVYISKGRKDDRNIIIIPAFAAEPASGGANRIEFLLLLNISFRENVPLALKIKALGESYTLIKSIVQENGIAWQDRYLDLVPMEELFGRSAEKIGEDIAARNSN